MFEERLGTEGSEGMSQDTPQLPAAVSDIGCEREINEDRYACFKSGSEAVWVVCDGMGGAVGGELAAQLAIDTIRRVLESSTEGFSFDLVAYAFQEANRVIVLRRQNPAFESMGTTIVAAYVSDSSVSFFHAGDSRAYLISPGGINQVTSDHTYVQDLVSRGMISEEEALNHPQSHVLTRCLGGQLKISFDPQRYVHSQDSAAGQQLLLCSDGLYSLLTDDEILTFVNNLPPQQACSRMVEAARSRGGFDNITVAVVPLPGFLDLSQPYEEQKYESVKPAAQVLATPEKKVRNRSQMQKLMMLLGLAFFAALSVSYIVLLLLGN